MPNKNHCNTTCKLVWHAGFSSLLLHASTAVRCQAGFSSSRQCSRKKGRQSSCHGSTEEERRRRCNSLKSRKPSTNPQTDAYILQHQKTIYFQPMKSQHKVSQYSKKKKKTFKVSPAKICQTRPHPGPSSSLRGMLSFIQLICSLHPHIPAHTAEPECVYAPYADKHSWNVGFSSHNNNKKSIRNQITQQILLFYSFGCHTTQSTASP